MPFGKHKGRPIWGLPTPYLRWLLTIDLSEWLEQAVRDELADRGEDDRPPRREPPRPAPADPTNAVAVVKPLVNRWYSDLVMRYHPDRGGSTAEMQAINDAHETLLELLDEDNA